MIFPDCARPVFYRPHRAISIMILSLPPLICYRGHFPVPKSIENLLLRLLTGWPLLTINCLDYTSIDVNFPSSLVCPSANSEYKETSSLADIPQIAVVVERYLCSGAFSSSQNVRNFPPISLQSSKNSWATALSAEPFSIRDNLYIWRQLFCSVSNLAKLPG